MQTGVRHPLLWEPYKKETPSSEGSGFMPATGRDAVVLPTKKGGTAGSVGKINNETGEVHIPWKQHRTKD